MCYHAILIRVWKFQTPLCILDSVKLHMHMMLHTLQCNSHSELKVPDPIIHYTISELWYIAYAIYVAILSSSGSESFRPHRALCTIFTLITLYTICYICFHAILIRVWKFQTPLCNIYYMSHHQHIQYLNFGIYHMLYMLPYDSHSVLKVSDPIPHYTLSKLG